MFQCSHEMMIKLDKLAVGQSSSPKELKGKNVSGSYMKEHFKQLMSIKDIIGLWILNKLNALQVEVKQRNL